MPVLTPEQVALYHAQGYLLVSGLIPETVSSRAREIFLLWSESDPRNPQAKTKEPLPHTPEEEAEVVACYTSAIMEASAQLVGDDLSTFRVPSRPFPLHSYPVLDEWKPWEAHIDHSIKADGHKTFPIPFRLASMLFLSDVEEHGGGTLVWDGSHKKIFALAETDPAYYEDMYVLNQELEKADIGECVELTPKCGDILFYHCLCAHSGSMNVRDSIRLAMNAKW